MKKQYRTKRPPGKPKESDKQVCEVALAALREGKTQAECAKIAGVCTYSLQRLLARNPDYRAQWDKIVEDRVDEWKQKVVDGLNNGLSLTRASVAAGIPETTVRDQIAIDQTFAELVAQADAKLELSLLKRIRRGKTGWQGSAWLAERKYRKTYAPPKMEFGDHGDERIVKVRRIVGAAVATLKHTTPQSLQEKPEPEAIPDVRASA